MDERRPLTPRIMVSPRIPRGLIPIQRALCVGQALLSDWGTHEGPQA